MEVQGLRERGGGPEASSKQMVEICNGLSYNCGRLKGITRGAVNFAMMGQVVNHCLRNGRQDLSEGLQVAWFAGLRYSQLARIQSGDCNLGASKSPEEGVSILTLRHDKRVNRKTMSSRSHHHGKRAISVKMYIFRKLQSENPRGTELFVTFDV